ncbi:peptidase M28 [Ornithinimicrobium avium]|uniref:Peptidase M28 n=1 Tax=Ornithinimicrobium avium TaxID=2283195 RepID=A0A345NQK7_9MICO|nr:peptidase M28 [Ornithinimicrobium avium]
MARLAPSRRRARSSLALVLTAGVGLSGVAGTGLVAGASPTTSARTIAPPQHPVQPLRQPLPEPPVDASDPALRLGLTPYHDVSRRINAAVASSDRVSAQVLTTTAGGRDVVMVTLTAPETPAQIERQQAMRELVGDRPALAARDTEVARDYKVPVLVDANIHGNEFEGTDAALRLVEEWATSTDPQVVRTLETTRVHLVISANPDGRAANTRRNAAGFDLNRDLLTASQPESRALREVLARVQPVMMIDLHGYVNGTLVEPTTPPHGENYEYDLFLKHAWPNALGIEQAILDLGYGESDGLRPPQVPLRDWDEGWDDWPPIFAPQYAALHGAVAHTVEIPLRVNNSSYQLPVEELRRRAAINTDVAHAVITATLGYVAAHRSALLADQIEVFRRGAAGEPQRRVADVLPEVAGEEDVWTTLYPRAYVIPVGPGQRSAPAAARLVDHLLADGVQVRRLTRAARIDGATYPVGSYVVDLHQPLRGLANTTLGPGTDISERVGAMYDISGWSLGLLWGADVVTVPQGAPLRVADEPVEAAAATASVEPSRTGWVLHLDDPADVAALTDLLGAGVPVQWLDDGSVLVPQGADAAAVAQEHGVQLAAAPRGSVGEPLEHLLVGVAGTPEERWAIGEMDLVAQPVSSAALNDGLDLSGLDALYVSSGLRWAELTPDARAELRSFVDDGGGVVARGPEGAALNAALGLLDVTAVEGRGDANGVVTVDNATGPLGSGAPEHTFVYAPMWFTGLGSGVVVEQRLAPDPLLSGHWRPRDDGTGGPGDAAGQALVVRGEDDATGARTVLIGSEPLFRAHPKGSTPWSPGPCSGPPSAAEPPSRTWWADTPGGRARVRHGIPLCHDEAREPEHTCIAGGCHREDARGTGVRRRRGGLPAGVDRAGPRGHRHPRRDPAGAGDRPGQPPGPRSRRRGPGSGPHRGRQAQRRTGHLDGHGPRQVPGARARGPQLPGADDRPGAARARAVGGAAAAGADELLPHPRGQPGGPRRAPGPAGRRRGRRLPAEPGAQAARRDARPGAVAGGPGPGVVPAGAR